MTNSKTSEPETLGESSTIATNRVFRWSFSQWESYYSCPARWKYKSVLKLPGKPPGPAAARGIGMHKTIDDYIEGRSTTVSDIIKPKYLPVIDEFKNHENGDRYAELKLAFDDEWSVVGAREPTASCIAILDAVRYANDGVLHIGEWKSGKPKDTHREQRLMYATVGLRKWNPTEVRVTTYYLEDTAPPQQFAAKQSALPKLIKIWDDRKSHMINDTICAPRPGMHCKWCDYSAAAGGPCAF